MEELQCAACLRKTSYLLAKKIGKYFFCEKCFPTNAANKVNDISIKNPQNET
jgi:hypothetical protein